MAIDFKATGENMKFVALRRLARAEGLVPETLQKFVFDPNYSKTGPLSEKMTEVLRKYGYLVETQDSEAAS